MKRIVAVMISFIFLTGCYQYENQIEIGVNLELTGGLAQYGQASLKGISLATEEINAQGGVRGKKIKLRILDNRSMGSEAALTAQRLQHYDQVAAILGPSLSSGVKASLGSGVSIPIITPTATANDLRISGADNVYRMCFTDSLQGEEMGRYANELGFKKVALLLNLASDYSINSGENFAKSFESKGGEVVGVEYYKGGDTDFNSVLTKLKEKDIEAVYFPGFYTEGGLIIKQARQLGLNFAFLSGDAFDSPELEEIAGGKENLTDIYFTNHYDPESGKIVGFSERYYKSFGEYPTSYSCLAYDSAMVLYQGLQSVDGDIDRIMEGLDGIKNYEGVTGTFSMGENRDAEKKVLLNQIKDGKRVRGLKEEG